MEKSKIQLNIQKFNFCRRVHQEVTKIICLERSGELTEKVLKNVLSLQEHKDVELQDLQLQEVKMEDAERHSRHNNNDMVAEFEEEIKNLKKKEQILE
ncbi:hypothetical protein EYF80_011659 [Liparis tanakae]|uniref:Uncharacterized protein n=1 Tax=Liparis tanakae TaxID=230148 RepID=A0A4Z2IKZ8_9TELE|nr:hypothetical protein EYF80_011659 [Liparis tanakae]